MLRLVTKRKSSPTLKALERRIKTKLRSHLKILEINGNTAATTDDADTRRKEAIRRRHNHQRNDRLEKAQRFFERSRCKLLPFFASGNDIIPERINPRLEAVASGTLQSELFRFASLTWSVPVSEGFGRRLRFLVWDDSNDKLMGIFALGDPVFNLKVRDSLIGWSGEDRKKRLVNVMDAYVLGAVPPYNMLLAGKLVACLVRTQQVKNLFFRRYNHTEGVISGQVKEARLAMITTTSSLGRSSIYNRLTLGMTPYFERIGFTSGFGHFQIPQDLFEEMRTYLRRRRHSYFKDNRFGNGPNWRFRTIRAALEMMGVKRDVLQHGIHREVFACKVADNALEFLAGNDKKPRYGLLRSVREVSQEALERWVCPRSLRRPEYKHWDRNEIINQIASRTLIY